MIIGAWGVRNNIDWWILQHPYLKSLNICSKVSAKMLGFGSELGLGLGLTWTWLWLGLGFDLTWAWFQLELWLWPGVAKFRVAQEERLHFSAEPTKRKIKKRSGDVVACRARHIQPLKPSALRSERTCKRRREVGAWNFVSNNCLIRFNQIWGRSDQI